jgi:hypothetical protein
MKIEFTSTDATTAKVTRGWLWWKRVAFVELGPDPSRIYATITRWLYRDTKEFVGILMDMELDQARAERAVWRRESDL